MTHNATQQVKHLSGFSTIMGFIELIQHFLWIFTGYYEQQYNFGNPFK
jgi:hypothetical protein